MIIIEENEKGKKIFFPPLEYKKGKDEQNTFYQLKTIKNFLIKYSLAALDTEEIYKMLNVFANAKDKLLLTDLPIGYYKELGTLKGTVVPYYQNSISLYQIAKSKNINNLSHYYYHDDNKIHNLYLLFKDILNILEELLNNNICYFDCNYSNFIIKNNQVKIIDFEPKYLKYEPTNKNIRNVLERYDDLLFNIHLLFKLENLCTYKAKDFKTMRKHLTKLENKIQKKITN